MEKIVEFEDNLEADIKSLLPVFKKFAFMWQKKIAINKLDDSKKLEISNLPVLNVHLFLGHPRNAGVISPEAIFGYKVGDLPDVKNLLMYYRPEPVYPHFYPGDAPPSVHKKEFNLFYSPEGHCLAQVKPNHIKILLDFSKISNNDAAKDILEIILIFCLPYAFPEEKPEKLKIICDTLRKQNILANDRKKKLAKSLIHYINSEISCSIQLLDRQILEKRKQLADIDEKLILTARKNYELEATVAELKSKFQNDQYYNDQLDQLVKMEDIASVAIEGKKLVIYTKDITKFQGEKSFALGAFRIEFDPYEKTRDHLAIRFFQYKSGEFMHPYIHNRNVCFGSDFNPLLDKLMREFELIPMVHLVLTFLKLEETEPNPEAPRTIFNPVVNSPKEMNINSFRQEYIAFMKEVVFSVIEWPAKNELAKNSELAKRLTEDYLEARGSLQINLNRLDYLKNKISNYEYQNSLLKDLEIMEKNIFFVSAIFRRGLRVWLYSEKLSWPVLVWIESGRLPYIISLDELNIPVAHNHALNLENKREELLKLLAQYEFVKIGLWGADNLLPKKRFMGLI